MQIKTKARLAMAAFLTACLIPSAGMLLLPESEAAANQRLAPRPSLTLPDGRPNPAFPQQLTDYTADHFAFRQELITAGAALESTVFHTSAEDSVLLGREGWLFYRETLPCYLHTEPLSDRALYGAAHTLALLREYTETHGARFLFTVAPNKASLYPQYLPTVGVPLEGSDEIDRLRVWLEREQVPYADLFTAFRAQPEILYHRLDSHWNARGAALAHDMLVNVLGKSDAEPFFNGEWHMEPIHHGDLYEMLYPAGRQMDDDAVFAREFRFVYNPEPRSVEDQRINTRCSGRSGSLLMFRDSFGNSLHRFLADSYKNAVFSRAMPYQMSLLDETGADTVILELVERNLHWLTERAPIFPAPVRGLQGEPPLGDATAAFSAQANNQCPGCIRLDGSLSGSVDADSPIYVRFGSTLYEASPVGTAESGLPFTLYIPEETAGDSACVLYLSDGALYASAEFPLES